MALPEGYELRAPAPDDVDAVAHLLVADEAANSGKVVLGSELVRGAWSRATFDPATDAWVAVDQAGAVVGYAQVSREAPNVVRSWGVVHPDQRGRGVGSVLLDRVEERAFEILSDVPSARFGLYVNAGDHAAPAMVEARGLRPTRRLWQMEIDLAGRVDPGRSPEGIEITRVDPSEDLRAVHAVLSTAFEGDWDHHPMSFDPWVEEHATEPMFDPTLWLLARDEGEPVGALIAGDAGDRGWVEEIGVLPGHRGRGIGAALLRRSFATFAGRGLARVLLNVDSENPTGATELYERVGMRIVSRWDLWERRLTGSV